MRQLHTSRPDKDETWLTVAFAISQQGTCARRKVGCVFLDKNGDVLATGYNGPPRGWVHCIDAPCPGADMPSGTGLSDCEAVHAEANALIQCRDPYAIDTVYCTDSPCLDCVKLLLNTSARRVVFLRPYTHPRAQERWTRSVPPRIISEPGVLREIHAPRRTWCHANEEVRQRLLGDQTGDE